MPLREQATGQVALDTPSARPRDRESPTEPGALLDRGRSWLRSPILILVLGCIALAALSAAVLPTVPSYDPWSWIVWGREVVDPHLSFVTGGGPSWKPLPVIFTTVFALFGGAAPTLWVIIARVGGLLALVAAWRLAARIAGGAEWAAGDDNGGPRLVAALAGMVAVLGLLLTQDFFYFMFRGTSEPMLVAATLWSIDRLLERRHGQAFAIGVALALMRPEAWPFLGLYALWLWSRQPRMRVPVVLGLLAIPVFWFVPTWIGSGQPFLAATHARDYNGHLGTQPVITALRRAVGLQVAPVLVGAAVAVVLTWLRERDRLTLLLAAGAVAWIAIVVAMVIDGYPGLERFFLPASALLCVLAGVGVARVAVIAARWVAPAFGGGATWLRVVTVAVVAVLIAVSIPLSSSRISAARAAKPAADRAVTILDQLSAAVRAVGGHAGVFPCRSSVAAVNHGVQTALAWKLHVTLTRVGTVLRRPGIVFIGPHNSVDGGPAPVNRRLTQMQVLARVGVWEVVRYTRPGAPSDACAGR
jgi:hypothetical protein